MGQAAGLGGNVVGRNQPLQRVQNRPDRFHRIGGRIHPDDRIAASEQQTIQAGKQDAADVIRRMIGLEANSQHAPLSHGVAAAGDHPYPGSGQHQVFIAHQLGNGGGHLRSDGPVQAREVRLSGFIIQDELAQFAYAHCADFLEGLLVVGFQQQPAYLILSRIDQRMGDDVAERHLRQPAFGRYPLLLGTRGNAGQLVARLFFVGPGKQLAEILHIISALSARPGCAPPHVPAAIRCLHRNAAPGFAIPPAIPTWCCRKAR